MLMIAGHAASAFCNTVFAFLVSELRRRSSNDVQRRYQKDRVVVYELA